MIPLGMILFSRVLSSNQTCLGHGSWKGFVDLTPQPLRVLNLTIYIASGTTEIQGHCQACCSKVPDVLC